MVAATDRSGLTSPVLEGLLQRLGPDREAGAREYAVVHRKLLEFFDRRGVALPEALADQTLDRVARKLAEGALVGQVRAYCYGVARNVLLEWQRHRSRESAALAQAAPAWGEQEPPEAVEARTACLERCLKELPSPSRALILGYYQGRGKAHLEERQHLARHLAITYAALKTRAHRIRAELHACLQRCLDERNQ